MKSQIDLTLVRENELSSAVCNYCGNSFDLDYRNTEYAVEIDGGSQWMHRNCAQKFGARLVWIARRDRTKVESSQSPDAETQYPHFGPDQ